MDKDMVLTPPAMDPDIVRMPSSGVQDSDLVQPPPGYGASEEGLGGADAAQSEEEAASARGERTLLRKGAADGGLVQTGWQAGQQAGAMAGLKPAFAGKAANSGHPKEDAGDYAILTEAPLYDNPHEGQGQDGLAASSKGKDVNAPQVSSIRRAAARMLVFGFKGTIVNGHARRLIAMGAGGVILFSRNVESPEQVARLCTALKQAAAPRPLIIMVDQEGGKVVRLGPPFTAVPSARDIGSTLDTKCAAAAGAVLGRELRAVGIDVDLAPVVDVDTNPLNPVIGQRSFSSNETAVSEMGYSFIRGLQRQGVAACVKHFPGHGDTSVDSHHDIPYLDHDLERLERVELAPFKKAVEADVAAILVSHVAVAALASWHLKEPRGMGGVSSVSPPQTASSLPATMSPGALHYLRHTLQFEGAVLTDCMEMGAIMKHQTAAAAVVEAVLAGVDLVLVCHTEARQVQAIDGLTEAALQGILPICRLEEAGRKLDTLERAYVRPPLVDTRALLSQLKVIGCKEHSTVVSNIRHKAAEAASRSREVQPVR